MDAKFQITFPESDQDHRLQLVEINGAVFAIVHSPLESQGPIHLDCEDWSLVLLAPLKSKSNVAVSAINVICLSEIISEEGTVNIHASNRLVKFTDLFKSPEKVSEIGEGGKFELEDDPGFFMYYYKLLDSLISNARSGTPDLISQAQRQFIAVLCVLADKIEGKPENLDIPKVLDVWKIPSMK